MVDVLDWPLLASGAIDADTILYAIKDPSGVPVDRRVTAASLAASSSFASLYAAAASLTSHIGATTAVHGIANTANVELTTRKNVVSGYVGLDTGMASDTNLAPPERRFVHAVRGANIYLSLAATETVREMFICDSMGQATVTAPEQTAFPAIYEAEMAKRYNVMPRSSGFVPIQCWLSGFGESGMSWGTSGVDYPAFQNEARGPNIANKRITNVGINFARTDPAIRRYGTGVSVFYTKQGTGGGVATITLNGAGTTTIAAGSNGVNTSTFAGAGVLNVASGQLFPFSPGGTLLVATAGTPAVITYTNRTATTFTGCTTVSGGGVMATGGSVQMAIDTRGGAAGTFSSGHRQLMNRFGGTYGPIDLVVTHAGIGTDVELEGAYFHANNHSTGIQMLRAFRAGQGWDRIVSTDMTTLMSVVLNYQPQIVTIVLGHNDVIRGRTAAQVAADMATVFAQIRAQYSTWTPAIRMLFQNDATDLGPTWLTDYRSAMRQAAITAGVVFLDGQEALGGFDVDEFDATPDGIHPNEKGHYVWGQLIADATVRQAPSSLPIRIGDSWLQQMGAASVVALGGATGAQIALHRNNGGVVVPSGVQLGSIGFGGIINATTGDTAITSAIRGRSEEIFSDTTRGSGVEIFTTAVGTSVFAAVAGLTGAGQLYVGATFAGALFTVSAAGAIAAASLVSSGSILANGGGAVGYGTGAGGTVVQATNKTTGVLLDENCGEITVNAVGTINAGATSSFTLTNNKITAGDLLIVNHISTGTLGAYTIDAACAAGSATIRITNRTGGSLTEGLLLRFYVARGVTA